MTSPFDLALPPAIAIQIGDPSEVPEIEIIPLVEPVPEPMEVPGPAPAPVHDPVPVPVPVPVP